MDRRENHKKQWEKWKNQREYYKNRPEGSNEDEKTALMKQIIGQMDRDLKPKNNNKEIKLEK